MITTIKSIVFADDDLDDIDLFKSALQETCPRSQLEIVGDGNQLLERLKKSPFPDAIVIDLNMPCKSGKQCLVEIRANRQFDKIPVIILSTSNAATDMQFCLSKGATQYFVKPNSFPAFKSLARNICSGNFFAMN
ncbi:MAG: response regulator [Bacteroidota bacterium]